MKFKKIPRIKALEMVIEMQFQKEPLMFEQAKQCALIAVTNIIESHEMSLFCEDIVLDFWKDVKLEIEKIW